MDPKILGPPDPSVNPSLITSTSNSGAHLIISIKYIEIENTVEVPHHWNNDYIHSLTKTSKSLSLSVIAKRDEITKEYKIIVQEMRT